MRFHKANKAGMSVTSNSSKLYSND